MQGKELLSSLKKFTVKDVPYSPRDKNLLECGYLALPGASFHGVETIKFIDEI